MRPPSIAPPSAALSRYVATVEIDAQRTRALRAVDYVPDGASFLVFRWFGGGQGDLGVRGPLTRARYKLAPAFPLAVRVAFRPGGAYPFFGVPMSELVDRVVPLEELWGAEGGALREELVAAAQAGGDLAARVRTALAARLRSAPFDPASALAARAAVGQLREGRDSIDTVARGLGLSPRHLLRAFQAAVGVSPKTYARIARFQRALGRARSGAEPWGQIARAVGYFDQAHLVADFQNFACASPERVAPRSGGRAVAGPARAARFVGR